MTTEMTTAMMYTPPMEVPALAMETTASALAAQVKATVEARYTLAAYRHRNWDDVRVKILAACRRPNFAHNKSVLYRKPIGAGVEGLGIRFVEEALRCMGNVMPDSAVVYDDPSRRILRVMVTDLENNTTYSQDIVLTKTVERSRPDSDGAYLSVRTNSQGKTVYTVIATEDEFANKESAARSKAIRSLGLRLIPGDIVDESEEIIRAIRRDRAAQDPAGERKRIADAFAALNITPANLEAYLGHPLAQCTTAELVDLRGLYGALRDGETTWVSIMENKQGSGDDNGNGKSNGKKGESTNNPVAIALLERITAATTLQELEGIKPDIVIMKGEDRNQVRDAYKDKKATLSVPQPEPDPDPDPPLADDYISTGQ